MIGEGSIERGWGREDAFLQSHPHIGYVNKMDEDVRNPEKDLGPSDYDGSIHLRESVVLKLWKSIFQKIK